MKKSTKMWFKQKLAWVLIVLMSINTFAAVVGDNDGAAFITKAEFESLKNDFQTQINRYNSSLDNKIAGAIANYLSGVRVAKKSTLKSLIKDDFAYLESFGDDNIFSFNENNPTGVVDVAITCLAYSNKDLNARNGWIGCTWTNNIKDYNIRNLMTLDGTKICNLYTVSANCDINKTAQGAWTDRAWARILQGQPEILPINGGMSQFNDSISGYQAKLKAAYDNSYSLHIAFVINQLDWELNEKQTNNSAKWSRQFSAHYDSTNKKYITAESWLNVVVYPHGNSAFPIVNAWSNIIAFNPTDNSSETRQTMAMWAPERPSYSASAEWQINPAAKTKTLCGYLNNDYKKPTMMYEEVFKPANITTRYAYKIDKTSVRWQIDPVRRIYKQVDDWVKDTNDKWEFLSSWVDGDNTPSSWVTVKPSSYIYPVFQTYDIMGYAFADGFDQTKLCYFNKDVLSSKPSDKLDNYLNNSQTRYGFPMFECEKNGKIEIKPIFDDTTKQYKVWFTNGPSLAASYTVKPTNNYDTNLTENTDGSVTIRSGDKVTFDVEKDDIVYMSWTIKDKVGGGKLKYPLEAILEEE